MTNYDEVIAELERDLARARETLISAQATVYRHEGALIVVKKLRDAQQKYPQQKEIQREEQRAAAMRYFGENFEDANSSG